MTPKSSTSAVKRLCLSLGLLAITSLVPDSAKCASLATIDFTGASPLASWRFYNGPEFPGATGSLTVQTGSTGNYAVLGFVTTCSAPGVCGRYVSANWGTATSIAVPSKGGVVFQLSPSLSTTLQLRVVDSTGQTLQYPISAFSLEKQVAGAFYQIVMPLAQKPQSYWGGSNNGVFSGAIRGIQIVAKPQIAGAGSGSVNISSVSIVDDVATTEDLATLTRLPRFH